MNESYVLPCGNRAEFDHASGCADRCTSCNAVIGSVGMPKECARLLEEQRAALTKTELPLGWCKCGKPSFPHHADTWGHTPREEAPR